MTGYDLGRRAPRQMGRVIGNTVGFLVMVSLIFLTWRSGLSGSSQPFAVYMLYMNPIPWLLAIGAAVLYFRHYTAHGQAADWPAWRAWSFLGGIAMTLFLWESPLNAFVGHSMILYTLKLMGEFELAAPLLVFGIPFSLIARDTMRGPLWGLLRFLHRPIITATILAILLVFWDMSNQMAWGLKSPLAFGVLPALYLVPGMIVWMQSLQVFPGWPNFSNHLKKAGYVWAMEMAMMAMGAIWFWAGGMAMNPLHGPWAFGLSAHVDQSDAGLMMTLLSVPTMCLVTWHFWQWIEGILHEPDEYAGAIAAPDATLVKD